MASTEAVSGGMTLHKVELDIVAGSIEVLRASAPQALETAPWIWMVQGCLEGVFEGRG